MVTSRNTIPTRTTGWLLAAALVAASGGEARPPERKAFAIEVPTTERLPVFRPSGEMERLGASTAVNAIDTLGEGFTVSSILGVAPQLMNVRGPRAEQVKAALQRRYAELDNDPRWSDVDSPLAQAFERRSPTMLIAPPRNVAVDPGRAPVVVFLHGYGGNGKIFAWLLSRALPDCWVVAPSHGLTWSKPRLRYLDAALTAFEQKTGRHPARYGLVGLSDGSVGAFQVLAARPLRFSALVSVVGAPPSSTIKALPRRTPQLWINGEGDTFVSARRVRAKHRKVAKRVGEAELRWLKGGHYFLLDDDQKALSEIRSYLSPRLREPGAQ